VWSFISGLAALGGRASRAEVEGLINPGFQRDGHLIQTKANLAGDTFGAATSLALIGADRQEIWLDEELPAGGAEALADALHSRLCGLAADDTNRVMLETYAWMAAESDRQGHLGWIYDWGRDEFADRAKEGLTGEDEDGHLMNTTKMVAWRRWMGFLGLSVVLPLPAPDYPLHGARTARELARAGVKAGDNFTSDQFVGMVAERQPYLDGGRLYVQACERLGHVPRPGRLSPLMSAGLRDLHDQGVLQLKISGDSGEGLALTGDDAHVVVNFNSVTINALEAVT
jgi:hypothetical protein